MLGRRGGRKINSWSVRRDASIASHSPSGCARPISMRTPSTVRPTGSGVPSSCEPGWPHLWGGPGRCGRPARICLPTGRGWPWAGRGLAGAGPGWAGGRPELLICRWRGLTLTLTLWGRTTAAASWWRRGAAGGGRGARPRCRPPPRVARAAPRAPREQQIAFRRYVFRYALPRCWVLPQPSTDPAIYPAIDRSIQLSIDRSIYPSIHLSACLDLRCPQHR